MIRVLFVCLGNICRSPMAEAVLRDKVRKAGAGDRIQVDSAGTGDWHTGDLPHFGTRKILKEAGISFNGIHARTVVPEDLVQFDRIIAMDRNNERDLLQLAGNNQQFRNKISRFIKGCQRKKLVHFNDEMNLRLGQPHRDKIPVPSNVEKSEHVYYNHF